MWRSKAGSALGDHNSEQKGKIQQSHKAAGIDSLHVSYAD